MFTGIVQAVGAIVSVTKRGSAVQLAVAPHDLDIADVATGDSVAVNGCCLTVTGFAAISALRCMTFDVSPETLDCTAGLDADGAVNLEKSLRAGDRLGGHLVAGHVDGVGTVVSCTLVDASPGDVTLVVEAPVALARFIARKGSIAIMGVSLTVNDVDGASFAVNLIPHTLGSTTLGRMAAGSPVNLEVDLIARYVDRLVRFAHDEAP
ncbi:MAG TPA: riboflavin synthase [Casimicrobiaceae bacterium]|nr:riboflavin synthase [Casimicrobiaceae bacterium]